jgi:hypothetical protein
VSHRTRQTKKQGCHLVALAGRRLSAAIGSEAAPNSTAEHDGWDLGGIILGGSSADFRTLITEETKKWAKVIRAVNIKPE